MTDQKKSPMDGSHVPSHSFGTNLTKKKMTHEEQLKHMDSFFDRMKEIMNSKGDDYANEDRLSNFKLAGEISQISPEQQCLSLIATKVARLGVLLKNKNPQHESIRDSVLDLANYALLLDMILTDAEKSELLCQKYAKWQREQEQSKECY